jgi:PP-loop superfamily ATP-utilizing enzyme
VCHTTCAEKVKGLCQVKVVPSGARRTIRFSDLNDPRPGGRVNPEGEQRERLTPSGIIANVIIEFCRQEGQSVMLC